MPYGLFIAVMYYGLLRMSGAFLIKVEDIRIVYEDDFKNIQINFDYQRKRKNNGFTNYIPSIYLPLFVNICQNYKQKMWKQHASFKIWM